MKNDSMINDLTEGRVLRQLISFSIPFVLANCLQFLYNVVDMIIVGQFVGSVGLSAVSVGGDLMHFFTFLGVGFSQAGQIIIAQYVGRGDRGSISRVVGTMFTFILALSLAITAMGLIGNPVFLGWLNTPEEAFSQALDYIMVCSWGMFFVYGYNIVSSILRGMGDSKRPLLFIGIAAFMNLVLDLLFVAVFEMGAMGAALATVIGQAFSFVVSLIYLYRRRAAFGFDFKPKSFAVDLPMLGIFLRLGVPICLQTIAISVSQMYVSACVNVYGVVASAVTGVSGKLSHLSAIVSASLNAAGAAMIGQNFGAGKYDRVSKIVWRVLSIGAVFAAVLSILLLCFPTQTFRLFTDDSAVLALSMEIVPVVILNFFGSASRSPSMSLVNGIGFAGMNFAMGILDGVVARIGLALLLGSILGLGIHGYWYGSAIAGFAYFVIGMPYFLSGAWKRRRPVID